jgi:molecular chaperone HscB
MNYFELLNIPVSLHVDESSLRQKFYELSKQFHPDTNPSDQKKIFEINKAYQCLRDPISRAYYLIELANITQKTDLPLDLAEEYFELQETSSKDGLETFKQGLVKKQEHLKKEFSELETAWSEDKLSTLSGWLVKNKYIRSMLEDIQKKLAL